MANNRDEKVENINKSNKANKNIAKDSLYEHAWETQEKREISSAIKIALNNNQIVFLAKNSLNPFFDQSKQNLCFGIIDLDDFSISFFQDDRATGSLRLLTPHISPENNYISSINYTIKLGRIEPTIYFWQLNNNSLEYIGQHIAHLDCGDMATRSDGAILCTFYEGDEFSHYNLLIPPQRQADGKPKNAECREIKLTEPYSLFNSINKTISVNLRGLQFLPDNYLTGYTKENIYLIDENFKLVNSFKSESSQYTQSVQFSPNKQFLFIYNLGPINHNFSVYQAIGNNLKRLFESKLTEDTFPIAWLVDSSLVYVQGNNINQFFPHALTSAVLYVVKPGVHLNLQNSEDRNVMVMPNGRIVITTDHNLISFLPASLYSKEQREQLIETIFTTTKIMKDIVNIVADYVEPSDIVSSVPSNPTDSIDDKFKTLQRLPEKMKQQIEMLYTQLQIESKDQKMTSEKDHTFIALDHLIKLIGVKSNGKECAEALKTDLPEDFEGSSKEFKKLLEKIKGMKFSKGESGLFGKSYRERADPGNNNTGNNNTEINNISNNNTRNNNTSNNNTGNNNNPDNVNPNVRSPNKKI